MEALRVPGERGGTVHELGRGRSGVVYRCRDEDGRDVARKVFGGDGAATLVHYAFFGAPNPYVWNEDAIACAFHRRVILESLVRFWFRDALCVATAYGTGWSEEHRAWALDTRFVSGRPAALHHPFSAARDGEAAELRQRIMKPLQKHLADSGFDGLVWQAGLGNPVALNNFLRTDSGWAWIDLESGVPALIPINPLTLVTFYLPRSFRHRRPLFDDVDVGRLRRYIADHRPWIAKRLGTTETDALAFHVDRLETHQNAWRTVPRPMRSIMYRLRRGDLTEAQAEWYAQRWPLWYARELGRGLEKGARRASRWLGRTVVRLLSHDLPRTLRRAGRFVVSRSYRTAVVHRYVQLRISAWRMRGQLSAAEGSALSDRLHHESVGSYLTDFGIHVLAIKPAAKLIQYGVIVPLIAARQIDVLTGAVLLVLGGSMLRTLYTLVRCGHAVLVKQRPPLVALMVGTLPVVGNTAFLVQKAFSLTTAEGKLAAFLLYDIFSWIGQRVPIWGGQDSDTEHRLNHLTDLVVRDRGESRPPASISVLP